MHIFEIFSIEYLAEALYEKLADHILLPGPYTAQFLQEDQSFQLRRMPWKKINDRVALAPFRYAAAKLQRLVLTNLYADIAKEIEEAITYQRALDDESLRDEDWGCPDRSETLEDIHTALTGDPRYEDEGGIPPSITIQHAQAVANRFHYLSLTIKEDVPKNTE